MDNRIKILASVLLGAGCLWLHRHYGSFFKKKIRMICDKVYSVFDDTQERIDKQTALFKKIEEKLTRLERAKRRIVRKLENIGIDVETQMELNFDSDLSLESGCDSYHMKQYFTDSDLYFYGSDGSNFQSNWGPSMNPDYEMRRQNIDPKMMKNLKEECVYASKYIENLMLNYIDVPLPPALQIQSLTTKRQYLCNKAYILFISSCLTLSLIPVVLQIQDLFERLAVIIQPYVE